MNRMYVKTLQDAVADNEDQLEPRKNPIQAFGMGHAPVHPLRRASAEDQAACAQEDCSAIAAYWGSGG